jgi:hypothetical protein
MQGSPDPGGEPNEKEGQNKATQRTLFKSAARELGADKSAKRFNDALKTVARQKPAAKRSIQRD